MAEIKKGVSIHDSELHFEFARSGGPGGQNVNKVETRVTVILDVSSSKSLDDKQKSLIFRNLKGRIDRRGILRISAQRSRSQWENRLVAINKLTALLATALTPQKRRVASRPTIGSRERRFALKQQRARTKRLRGRISPEG